MTAIDAYNMMVNEFSLIETRNSNASYVSAYNVFQTNDGKMVAMRAANHGTFLYNWLKMQDDPYNIDLTTSANVAITFIDEIQLKHKNGQLYTFRHKRLKYCQK